MNAPNQLHVAAAVRSRLTQLRARLGKLLSLAQATAKHFTPVTVAKRAERLCGSPNANSPDEADCAGI
ncbi:MAG: hypothetical protein K8963_11345 [Proteobacteria bacterium]|nr:hypothetical protein [Pseudomonadota bacterium]